MNCSSIMPNPHQPSWVSYVYYVVMQCSCGHSYYYPSRRQIELDDLTTEKIIAEIQDIPNKIDTVCGECGSSAKPIHARRAVVGYGMPDRSGCILCDFAIEQGEVQSSRFRFDATPDPIQYFREHPDYFRTRPPDSSPAFLDDQLCLSELGRALNARTCWQALLQEALQTGTAFLKLQDGYYIFATKTQDPLQVECDMKELASDDFWHHFQNEPIPKRRLIGIDRWSQKQKEQTALQNGIYHEWLDYELVSALQAGKVHAIAFLIDSIAIQYFQEAAQFFDVAIDEVASPETGEAQLWIRNASGLSRALPPLELLQLIALYKGRLLSDQIWITIETILKSLDKEEQVFHQFHHRLPPGYSAQWTNNPGKLMICREDNPIDLLTFAHIADRIEPNDDEALSRLVSWLISNKSCECNRYVGKRLMSKSKFQECSSELMNDPEAFVFREKDERMVEIYTDECEHHVIYGLRKANGNLDHAEAMYQQDLPIQRYSLSYLLKKGFFKGIQMLVLMGRDAASIAAHPALLRGVLRDLNVRFGERVRVFAPFNGILTIGGTEIEQEKLEKFAYEIARELPESPEIKSDHLCYHAILELADEPLGTFQLEAYQEP